MTFKSRATGIRVLTVFVSLIALLLLAGCGDDDKKPAAEGAGPTTELSADITLTAEKDGFDKSKVDAKAGTIKITVVNPKDSGGEHGVGIDGGDYKDVKGAPVKPGRSTSLTVTVKEGKYTIFDSYKNNRDDGFETKLTVTK